MLKKLVIPAIGGFLTFLIGLSMTQGFLTPAFLIGLGGGLATHYIVNFNDRASKNRNYDAYHRKVRSGYTAVGVRSTNYAPSCQVCWWGNLNGQPHDCNGKVSYLTYQINGMDAFEGSIIDGLGETRWSCGHRHEQMEESAECSFYHLDLHQRGYCVCTYFCPPIDPSIEKSKKAHVYVVKHEQLKSIKVGISGKPFPWRVQEHLDNGWTFVAAYPGIDGVLAYKIEQSVIGSWRMAGLPKHLKSSDMPQGGATETVSAFSVDLNDLMRLIEKAAQVPAVTTLPQRRSRENNNE